MLSIVADRPDGIRRSMNMNYQPTQEHGLVNGVLIPAHEARQMTLRVELCDSPATWPKRSLRRRGQSEADVGAGPARHVGEHLELGDVRERHDD
jgi:hypothetical protein